MENNIIGSQFITFRNQTIPMNASAAQVEDMKSSFFAGAYTMMNTLLLSTFEKDEQAITDLFDKLTDEITEHFESKKG